MKVEKLEYAGYEVGVYELLVRLILVGVKNKRPQLFVIRDYGVVLCKQKELRFVMEKRSFSSKFRGLCNKIDHRKFYDEIVRR